MINAEHRDALPPNSKPRFLLFYRRDRGPQPSTVKPLGLLQFPEKGIDGLAPVSTILLPIAPN